jgi:hypothetical protein
MRRFALSLLTIFRTARVGFALLTSATGLLAQETNTPVAQGASAFGIIAERNIFNPNRSSRASVQRTNPPPTQVDSFTLVGTMSYAKGNFAFFDGTDSEWRTALSEGGKIAGYSVVEILPNSVKLENSGRIVELRVQSMLQREDGGEWHVELADRRDVRSGSRGSGGGSKESGRASGRTSRRESRDRSTESTGSDASSGSKPTSEGDADDVLKRLMEQREKELK